MSASTWASRGVFAALVRGAGGTREGVLLCVQSLLPLVCEDVFGAND
jgi:hypothetical protein